MRTLSLASLTAALLILVFAIPQTLGAMSATVNITDTGFIGKTVDILPGDTVTWVNAGISSHSIIADNGSFGSGTLAPGATFKQVFSQVGSYPYYDAFGTGAGFTGLVRVVTQTPIPGSNPVPAGGTSVVVPAQTQAQTQSLYAQVLQLQQLLAQLQAKQGSGGSVSPVYTQSPVVVSSAACPRIGRALKPGMSGDDVLRLQQFLAGDPSVYPEGQATGYYGVLTQAAVQRWQIKYNIVSTGTIDSTGFGMVGPRTAAAIALQCSTVSGGGITTGGTNTNTTGANVGGFIQVTPVSGNAPLAVSVQANVNTVNSCLSAMYILDWGDGTGSVAIPVSANTCQTIQQTYTHSYQYGGQYTIKLSAGGHESVATVVVNGPGKPTDGGGSGSYGGLVLTAPVGGQNFAPGQTISIAWQTNSTLPAGSQIVFDLYTGAGAKVSASDVIGITTFPSGALSWLIPTPGGVCPAIYPGKLCGATIPTGSYKIVAKAYQPSAGGSTFGTQVAEASSGNFTIIAAAAPTTPLVDTFTASATSGTPPLTVTFAGKVTSANQGWCAGGCFNLLQFGDGSSEFITLPIATNASIAYSIAHTYQNPGSYTATLYQSSMATGPTVGTPITITVGNAGSNFTYGPLELGPGESSSALSISATFDLPSACTGYTLTWGDTTPAITQAHATNCAQTPVVRSHNHTFSGAGTYNVALSRGPEPARQDAIGISIVD